MREIGDRFAIINLPKREVVAADTWMPDEGDAEERLRVEGTNDEDGSVVFFACAVELVADVDANRAPPDFPRVIEGPVSGIIELSFCGDSRGRSLSS